MFRIRTLYHRWTFFFLHWGRRAREYLACWRQMRPLSGWWWFEMWVRLLELTGLFVIYEVLAGWIKWNTRPLTAEEYDLGAQIFKGKIRLDLVRIDSRAFIGSAQKRFAYVSMHTLNCWRNLDKSVFIHELVHVWQYERMGAAYIVRALKAQYSPEGYNYGGVAAICEHLHNKRSFLEFNLEQQADIVMDYFRLKNGKQPQWGRASFGDLVWYERLLAPHFNTH